jgi:hypothetical protein
MPSGRYFGLGCGNVLVVATTASVVHANSDTTGTTLRVRQLVVVDERGIERVRIGAPLPDPVIEGKA